MSNNDAAKTIPLEDWISTAEAAELLGVSQRRVNQMIDEGKLIAQKMHPRLTLVSRTSVKRYLAEQE